MSTCRHRSGRGAATVDKKSYCLDSVKCGVHFYAVIALINQNDGVGKTATAVNLGNVSPCCRDKPNHAGRA